jgi:predicted transcriptional regulator
MQVERSGSGVFRLTQNQVDELASVLGVTPPVPDLSPTEARVLAALSRSPRGVASVREAARRAGTSPTATARALASLTSAGLVMQTHAMLARGRATEATVYQVPFASPRWVALAPAVAQIQLPGWLERTPATKVPPHLLHLFWNVAPAQLDVASSAPFIARRLITSFDPDGLAWGIKNLPASAWEHAAATRGLEPAKRALAHNLARNASDAR